MRQLTLLHIKLQEYTHRVDSIYEILFLGATAVLLMILANQTASHTLATCSGLLSGFSSGILLVKMPAIIRFFEERRANRVN